MIPASRSFSGFSGALVTGHWISANTRVDQAWGGVEIMGAVHQHNPL
jgi:hypothetical protein